MRTQTLFCKKIGQIGYMATVQVLSQAMTAAGYQTQIVPQGDNMHLLLWRKIPRRRETVQWAMGMASMRGRLFGRPTALGTPSVS